MRATTAQRADGDMVRDTVGGAKLETGPIERSLLLRYRVLAFTTATLLLVLVFVGLPLQFAAGKPEVGNDVGTVHGILYVVYLVVAFQLTRRLGTPKWKMGLVLLAGTVPFCAFIAERKVTRWFEARNSSEAALMHGPADPGWTFDMARLRARWFSGRAVLLHLAVIVLASGCLIAGWWQATRALEGNALSWFYSVEWPVFALLSVAGWWYLIHEDPEARRARKQRQPELEGGVAGADSATDVRGAKKITIGVTTARLATLLAGLLAVEFVLGIVVLILVPIGRPSGWLPKVSEPVYLLHAILGLPLTVGAVVLVGRVGGTTRLGRLSGRIGLVGVAMAGVGGVVAESHLLRLTGMVLMFIGALIAGFGYVIPTLEKLS
jgi:integral membrane protein